MPAAASPAARPPAPDGLTPYATFIKDAEKQSGLFTLWRKDGRVYLELTADQFDKEYVQTAQSANGLGGFHVLAGDVFQMEARILKFVRDGRRVAMIWPHTRFAADPSTPLAEAVRASTADSVEGMATIVSEDKESKRTVLDLSTLLGDVADFTTTLNERIANPKNPLSNYRLDPTRSYFGPSKAFPKNVIVETDQTFTSAKPEVIDTVVDPRSVQMRIKYNFAEIMSTPGYMPRLTDDRVGFWSDPHIQFGQDQKADNRLQYVLRWSMQKADPAKALSAPLKPIVYTISSTVPLEYRQPIKDGILEWNKAFERIGISNAIQVQDQPADPAFDPEDIRYNVVRWLTESNSGGFAEAQILWDPRSGEIFRSGVLIDSDIMRFGKRFYDEFIPAGAEPAGQTPAGSAEPLRRRHSEAAYARGMREQMQFGAVVMSLLSGWESVPEQWSRDYLKAIVLHEVGHDFGLGHNFIGHNAYTLAQVRDRHFTERNGLASSVMEYTPINLPPVGRKQGGSFNQTVLGPYDYHAIRWGYAAVPGAKTPQDEVATLNRWASDASDPKLSFASDEDVAWNGHAVDPRIEQFMLSNDPISWCDDRMALIHGLMQKIDQRYPKSQAPWEDERVAFAVMLNQYQRCATVMSHYMGAEYLSRARRGDPHSGSPLTPVPVALEKRAYAMLSTHVFGDAAWNFAPATLRRLVYTEYAPFADFGYAPTPRHDLPLAQVAGVFQGRALGVMFAPLTLQRLADLPTKARPGETMTLGDLFAWTQASIFGDIGKATATTQIHRNLQRRYSQLLMSMVLSPKPATPFDAQALARHQLTDLQRKLGAALRGGGLDMQTRAHFESMKVDVDRTLEAKFVVPAA